VFPEDRKVFPEDRSDDSTSPPSVGGVLVDANELQMSPEGSGLERKF